MTKSLLLHALRRELGLRRFAIRHGVEVERLRDLKASGWTPPSVSRRSLLQGTALAGVGLWVQGCGDDSTEEPGAPRIAIVGAGIGGLTAALMLRDGGYSSTVYELSKIRVGGRMISEGGAQATGCGTCHAPPASATPSGWADDQVTNIYGELIDSDHETIKTLAQRFSLPMVNALEAEPAGATETYYFGNGYYTTTEATADFVAMADALYADAEAAGYPSTFDAMTDAGKSLDSTSIEEWIESRIPGGNASRLGSLLGAAYTIEYGADIEDQSSLNLINMLSDAEDELKVFGASDEALRISGGNGQLPAAIAESLGSAVRLGYELRALRKESDATYTLSFLGPSGAEDIKADIVILALPFSVVRTLDISKAGFDERKRKAIQELGAGKNGKMHLQFTKRIWNESGPWGVSGGTSFSDTGLQATWDTTRGQSGTSGILVCYSGGSRANGLRLQHAYGNAGVPTVAEDAAEALGQLEQIFPGIRETWNGKVAASMAHKDRRFNASYSYWRKGQIQAFGGYEGAKQGNVYFAGEHTSLEYQGYMEGAASEGVRVAQEILATLPKASVASGLLARPRRTRHRRFRRS